MSYYDLYRDRIQDNFSPDDADADVIECASCGAVLPIKPTGFEMVRDKILAVDGYGAPVEWSWVNEPVWKCTNCDYENELSEVSR